MNAYGHWHPCVVKDAAGSEMTSRAAVNSRLEGEERKEGRKDTWSWGKQQKEGIIQKLQRTFSSPAAVDKAMRSTFTKSKTAQFSRQRAKLLWSEDHLKVKERQTVCIASGWNRCSFLSTLTVWPMKAYSENREVSRGFVCIHIWTIVCVLNRAYGSLLSVVSGNLSI